MGILPANDEENVAVNEWHSFQPSPLIRYRQLGRMALFSYLAVSTLDMTAT
jgi:hypothetical protein